MLVTEQTLKTGNRKHSKLGSGQVLFKAKLFCVFAPIGNNQAFPSWSSLTNHDLNKFYSSNGRLVPCFGFYYCIVRLLYLHVSRNENILRNKSNRQKEKSHVWLFGFKIE